MGGYRDYEEMIGTARPVPDGVTTRDFNVSADGYNWYGTLYVKDGRPQVANVYI